MKKNKNIKKDLDWYIEMAKCNIYVYIMMTIIVFFILLYISYKVDSYYILLFDIVLFLRKFERIETYFNLKKIKNYLIDNKLSKELGEIDFFNERNYFLAENYMIILKNGEVFCFKYSEIIEIYKKTYYKYKKYKFSLYEEYLHIITNSDEFKVLISTNVLVGEEFKDISDYLLSKNQNIKTI